MFRYRRFDDKTISALKSDRLYFSIPESFNDPYDNLLYVNFAQITADVASNLYYGMGDYLEELKGRNPLMAFYGYQMLSGPECKTILENFFDKICNFAEDISFSIRSNAKIICFSEVYNSMLMWAHYANYHSGFALIYDKDDLTSAKRLAEDGADLSNKIRLEKVGYVEEQIDMTADVENYVRFNRMINLDDQIEVRNGSISPIKLRKTITQKSKEWSYEKEWRIIPRTIDLEAPSPLYALQCIPKGIILGAHASEQNINYMIAMGNKKEIPVYAMCLDQTNPMFKLRVGPSTVGGLGKQS